MIAAIIGSTGLTGSLLIRRLLAEAAITRVVSVSRRPVGESSPKLSELLIDDLDELPSHKSELAADLYFCCLGTTIGAAGSQEKFAKVDHTAVVAFARIAAAQNARSLTLVSAMGANEKSRIFYNRIKGRAEADVQSLGLKSLIIFRPALLVGPRVEVRPAERIAARTLVPLARILPRRVGKRIVTKADVLATRMLEEGKAARPGVHFIAAADI